MSIEGFTPVVLEGFGGRYTAQDNKLETPAGYASDELNCDFLPGRVFKRPGLSQLAALSVGAASLSPIIVPNTDTDLLVFSTAGTFSREAAGVVTALVGDFSYGAGGLYAAGSVNMFAEQVYGRLFIALGYRSQYGVEMPRQYHTTRTVVGGGQSVVQVAPEGPAEAPSAVEGAAGTLDMPGGTYRVRVFWRTRTGHWSAPSPYVSVAIKQGTTINLTNIPVGPTGSAITSRVVCFTPVDDTENYFFIPGAAVAGPSMEISDNTTTTLTGVEFKTAALIAGTPVSSDTNPDEDLMRLIELPPQSGVVHYKGRMAWWGGQNNVHPNGDVGLRNLSFDGGFSGNRPLGWTEVAAGGVEGFSNQCSGAAFKVTGDGVNQRGRIQNNGSFFDAVEFGRPLKVFIHASINDPQAAGTFHVFLTGTGAPTAAADFNVTSLTSANKMVWLSATLLAETDNKPKTDWRLNFTTGGTGYGGTALSNAKELLIDRINVVYSDEETTPSLVRWSKAGDPEAYDGLYGIMNVAEDDGQAIRAGFVLRDNCYFAKPTSIFMTRDNSITEPNEWQVDEVATGCGAYSPRAVGVGDGWAILYGPRGIYYFDGGMPISISDEIATDLPVYPVLSVEEANTWVAVDPLEKRIYVGVPTSATEARIFYCRYEGASPVVGKRNWSIWSATGDKGSVSDSNSGVVIERGGPTLVIGETSTPRIGKFAEANRDDYTTAINSYYQTAYVGRSSGRNLIGYVTLNASGVGTLDWWWVKPDGTLTALPGITLQNPFTRDVEQIVRVVGERNAFRFGTNAVGETWSMQKFVPYINIKPGSPVRGVRG